MIPATQSEATSKRSFGTMLQSALWSAVKAVLGTISLVGMLIGHFFLWAGGSSVIDGFLHPTATSSSDDRGLVGALAIVIAVLLMIVQLAWWGADAFLSKEEGEDEGQETGLGEEVLKVVVIDLVFFAAYMLIVEVGSWWASR
jgi:hypothetical protein